MKDDIHQSLQDLRNEIGKLSDADQEAREQMESLLAQIEAQAGDAGEPDDSLLGSIRHSIEQYEVEHPRLTGVLNQMMVSLSNMGI